MAAGTAKVMRQPGQVSSGPRTEALASSITCSAGPCTDLSGHRRRYATKVLRKSRVKMPEPVSSRLRARRGSTPSERSAIIMYRPVSVEMFYKL
jgi:hypothetical protein